MSYITRSFFGRIILVTDVVNAQIEIDRPTGLAGGSDWIEAGYSSGDYVWHGGSGGYWKANATTLDTDVPGVSSKWTLVGYATLTTVIVSGSTGDGSVKIDHGELYAKDPRDGLYKKAVPTVVGDALALPFED